MAEECARASGAGGDSSWQGQCARDEDERETAVGLGGIRLNEDAGCSDDEGGAPSDDEQRPHPDRRGSQNIDHDMEDEEIAEVLGEVGQIRARREASNAESTESEASPVDPKVFEGTAKAIIAGLPKGNAISRLVLKEVQLGLVGHRGFLAPLAAKLSATVFVKETILSLWDFLIKILEEGIGKPPTSARAAKFTLKRRKAHEGQMQAFICNATVFATACAEVGEERAVRYLGLFFNTIDEATWHALTRAVSSANCFNVTYPRSQLDLEPHQGQILFFLAGWLLSSALSRVSRDGRLGPLFCPFVNSHKHADAAAFRQAHPGLSGLESEVSGRNVHWRGLSLIYADAAFYEFVVALESGYFHTLKNPSLLATYLGDLPRNIFEVVSNAGPVKSAFRRCVESVTSNGGEESKGVQGSEVLFQFFLSKWHNMRMSDFTKRLSKVQSHMKQAKKDTRALRDKLNTNDNRALRDKVRSGKGASNAQRPPEPTSEQLETRVQLANHFGAHAFRKLSKSELIAYIKECGGVARPAFDKTKLQSILRGIAPGIGVDPPEGTGEGNTTNRALASFLRHYGMGGRA